MADITRVRPFTESDNIQRIIFQKDKYVMDDELTALQLIVATRERRILSRLVNGEDVRFDVGFTVIGSAGENTVTVKGGACAVAFPSGPHSILLYGSDTDVTGWTTPSGSDRTDYLYLDVYEDEIDSTEDPNLINPARGEETTRDLRLVWTFEKSEGSTPGSPPTGHRYISIARIERSDGVAVIDTGDITNLLGYHFAMLLMDGSHALQGNLAVDAGVTIDGTDVSETLLKDGSRNLTGNLAVDAGVTIDGTDVSETLLQDGSRDLQGNLAVDAGVTIDGQDVSHWKDCIYSQFLAQDYRGTGETTAVATWSGFTDCFKTPNLSGGAVHVVLRVPYYKHLNLRHIELRCEGYFSSTGGTPKFHLEVIDKTGSSIGTDSDGTGAGSWQWYHLGVDVSSETDGDYIEIAFGADPPAAPSNADFWMRKVVIFGVYEVDS